MAGKVSPLEDIEFINLELALADLDSCGRAILRQSKRAKGGEKEAKFEFAVLEKLQPVLSEGQSARSENLTKEELLAVGYLKLLTLKPTMNIANFNENFFENNPHLDAVVEFAAEEMLLW